MEKIQTHVLADFRQTSTTPSHQASNRADRHWQSLMMFTHQLCHPVSPLSLAWFDSPTGRIPPTVLYCWWWCHVTVGIPAEFQPATPEPWTTTVIIGANDSVTSHAWAHNVPRSRRRDTGGNDGFTAWQIRIRSLDRRLRLLAVLWRYSGQIALMLLNGLHGWSILWQEKKNFRLAEKWSG